MQLGVEHAVLLQQARHPAEHVLDVRIELIGDPLLVEDKLPNGGVAPNL